ncbi:MAG: DUF6378 domain-containing protein [Gallionellaceae bacterium]
MTRKAILEKAIEITTGSRQRQHGSPEDVFEMVAELWSTYIQAPLTAEEVCHMMTFLKIARMRHGELNGDDYVDSIGYQAIAGELAGANV